MRRARSYVIALALAVAHGSASGVARADDEPTAASVDEARKLFREAVEREDAGDQEGALALYRKALAHRVSPQLLFNIASCEERLDRLLDAARSFRDAERQAKTLGNEEVLLETRARLQSLEKVTPRFFVRRPPGMEDTEVLLDGAPSFTSEGPVLVDPGDHRVVAHAPDGATFEIALAVRRGDVRTIDVVFAKSTAGTPLAGSPPAGAEPLAPARPSFVPVAIAGGATLVLGTVAAVTFAAGSAKQDRYVELNDAPTLANEAERITLSEDGRSLYVASTVFGISAAVAGAATVFFLVRSLSGKSAPRRAATWVLPSARGVGLGGAF
jgi:hypothetical protein